jgi:hypothetical protein
VWYPQSLSEGIHIFNNKSNKNRPPEKLLKEKYTVAVLKWTANPKKGIKGYRLEASSWGLNFKNCFLVLIRLLEKE